MGKTNFGALELSEVAAVTATDAALTAAAVTAAGTADVASTFVEAEVQAIQDLAAANKVQVNKLVTDVGKLVTLTNALKAKLNEICKG